MSSTTVQSLSRATTATFEDLALLFPETELSPEQAVAPLDFSVSLAFCGSLTGRTVVRALGEIGNVICGNVLPLIAGADKIFNLAAPIVVEGGSLPQRDEDEPVASVQVGLEDGRAEAILYLFSADASRAA
jgi:hypothetical protein